MVFISFGQKKNPYHKCEILLCPTFLRIVFVWENHKRWAKLGNSIFVYIFVFQSLFNTKVSYFCWLTTKMFYLISKNSYWDGTPSKEERGFVDFHHLPKRILELMIHQSRAYIKGFKICAKLGMASFLEVIMSLWLKKHKLY